MEKQNLISRMELNDNKAGMEGLDKEKINQIIYESSKGKLFMCSKFFENEQKKEEQLNQRIKEQQALVDSISPAQLHHGLKEANRVIKELQDCLDLSRTIVHVDMDAFYAAVEMRDDPRLKNKPMAVGSMGMLSTSNYIARRFGVRAAMPGFIGLKLCPNLVLVKPNFDKYTAVSKEIRGIFAQYDPHFSPMSLDEAYLDFTEHLNHRILSKSFSRLFLIRKEQGNDYETNSSKSAECLCDLNALLKPHLIASEEFEVLCGNSDEDMLVYLSTLNENNIYPLPGCCSVCNRKFPSYTLKLYGVSIEDAVLEMRNRIEQLTRLTASAGIAPNTMLAKICSDKNKPNGQFHIHPDRQEIDDFIRDLPIRKISGIGKVTEKLLGALGVKTCNDLYKQRALLYHVFSQISFQYFMRIALGMGSIYVERDEDRKSMSTEQTFGEINEPNELYSKCEELCQILAKDLDNEHLVGKTVSIKIKTVSFAVKTRSHSLQHFTNDEKLIFNAAKQLLKTEIEATQPDILRLRLMGVRMSRLTSQNCVQSSIQSMFKKNLKSETSRNYTNAMNISTDATSSTNNNQFKTEPEQLDPIFYYNSSNSPNLYRESDEEDYSHVCDSPPSKRSPLKDKVVLKSSTGTKKKIPKDNNKQTKTVEKDTILRFVYKKESTNTLLENSGHNNLKYVDVFITNENEEVGSSRSTGSSKSAETTSTSVISSFPSTHNKSSRPSFTSEHFNDSPLTCVNHEMKLPKDPPAISSSIESMTDPSFGMVTCPVCGQQKLNWPLEQLNIHVDLCLSKNTVKDILHRDEQTLRRSKALKRDGKELPDLSLPCKKRIKTQMTVESYFK
ncbi:unnamed protein product [Lymnaea stagnalis]|uniref:DNA polymerase kappa n=1 Tax=Lymnaea stagnalis TaxID=6523 RepID=A0AAV2HB06_LYMST